jgi:hypothetical protein
MTKRDVVKIAINYAISGAVSSATETVIENNTDIVVEDNLAARVGCAVIGVYVASRTKPLVSNAVDKVADWRIARKAEKTTEAVEPATA